MSTEHIDHTGIWTVAAALVLPANLLVLLVVAIRAQRYAIARKPPVRVLFGTAAILASVLGAHAVATITPLRVWLIGDRPLPTGLDVLWASLALLAALATYYGAQTLVVGVARGLRIGWSWRATIGTAAENVDFAITMCLGLVAACVVQVAEGLVLLAVTATAIVWTRGVQRIESLEQERDQLEVDALHDPLTGLPNRRGFDSTAQVALLTDQSRRRETAVLMFDLDHFKAINTRLGHIGADQVLAAVATAVREQIREGDLVCRWGGEEIALLLPNTRPEDAELVAERIRGAVERLTVEVTVPSGGKRKVEAGFTISGGVAFSPMHGSNLTALQEVADSALQQSKDQGRNRVTMTQLVRPRPPS